MSGSTKLGVTALLPALLACAAVGNLSGKVLEDSEINLKDLKAFMGAMGELSAITNIKPGQAALEALDLDDAEKKQLNVAFREKFDLKDDVAEEAVEKMVGGALKVLVGILEARDGAKMLFPGGDMPKLAA